MRHCEFACNSCLNPAHWPISRKVAAGPVILVALLCLVIFSGWEIADQHQRLMSTTYMEYAAHDQAARTLPQTLSQIQTNLYKLTIWSQISVEGSEVNATLLAIDEDFDAVEAMIVRLEQQRSVDRMRHMIDRYRRAVEQALILIDRNPSVGATATRGLERVYLEADEMAKDLAASAKDNLDQKLQQAHESWHELMITFLLVTGMIVFFIPLLGLGADRAVARPIKGLARLVDRFRQGELEIDVPWTIRRDEIGFVARAIETLRVNLIRNQLLEREREQLNHELELKVAKRTQELAEQKEQLAKALEKEHELSGLQRQFVSMVCHEFRTPLAIIDGNAQRLIKRHGKMPEERLHSALLKVRTSVTRLTELMESVLSASRLEAGTIHMDLAPCNLAEMIIEVAGNHQEVNPSYKISTNVDNLPDYVVVDAKLIRQVISNLISNAVKYSPDGSDIRLETSSCADGSVRIAVHDQGVGIPSSELDRLFERFFRASTSTGIAGTGIGLHMVKTLVDMHGGSVDVTSEEGVGSTFSIYLPKRDNNQLSDERHTVEAA